MFSRPKILFLVSLLFVALLNPKFNPYLPFKFLIFYHSSHCKTYYHSNVLVKHFGIPYDFYYFHMIWLQSLSGTSYIS